MHPYCGGVEVCEQLQKRRILSKKSWFTHKITLKKNKTKIRKINMDLK